MKGTFTLSVPLEESSDEHNSWEAAGRLIKNVFVRIDYTLTNFVQIDDHRTRRREWEREGRTGKNSIWIMHGKQGRRKRTNRSSKREGLSFGLMSLFFLLFHSLVSGREVHEDAPDVWSFFSSCPVLSLSFSVCNVCVLCYCPCGWVQYTWQDTQSVFTLYFLSPDSPGDSVGERKVSVWCPVVLCP